MMQAVFFDVDGTLLSHRTETVPTGTEEAFLRLKRAGVKVFAATGRHMLELEKLPVRRLPFDGYVTLNGQICLDAGKALLYDAPVGEADTKELAAAFARRELPLVLIERDRLYINTVNQAVWEAQRAVAASVPQTGVYTGNPIYQGVAFGNEKDLQPLMERLPGCKMNGWNSLAFDIIPQSGGKAAGIRVMLERYGLRREEIMAFGDGDNDIEMLCFAGIGVAMGNAGSEVKRRADYVTSGVDEDGIRQALEFYGVL